MHFSTLVICKDIWDSATPYHNQSSSLLLVAGNQRRPETWKHQLAGAEPCPPDRNDAKILDLVGGFNPSEKY